MFVNTLTLLSILLTASSVPAYVPQAEVGGQNDRPEAIEGVSIDEKPNQALPPEIILTDENGDMLKIADFYNGRKPLILSLVYFACPSLCNLHLRGVFEVFKELGLKPGKDFEFLAVSIDPGEDHLLARDKKKVTSQLSSKRRGTPGGGFIF